LRATLKPFKNMVWPFQIFILKTAYVISLL
jgi:hypothetical protein